MKSYTLTQISGSNYTVYLDGTILTTTEFETAFISNAGSAEFTSSVATTGATLWDSAEMTGNSISTTEAIKANTPYNGAWSAGTSPNTFTSFTEAKGKGLTDYQLSSLAKIAKEGKVKTLTTADYNWPQSGTKTSFNPALADAGVYVVSEEMRIRTTGFNTYDVGTILILAKNKATVPLGCLAILPASGTGSVEAYTISGGTNWLVRGILRVEDNLNSNDSYGCLSAKQGKVLKDLIDTLDVKVVNFTGTDGTTAGTAGLVPAPATTDADKFLKSDGTWDEAGGSGIPTDAKFWGASYDATNNRVNRAIVLGVQDQSTPNANFEKIDSRVFIHQAGSSSATIQFNSGKIILYPWNEHVYVSNKNIKDVADPTNPQDAATKHYVDTHGAAAFPAETFNSILEEA